MLASILIILASAVLLAYWFRYTCLLMLRSQEATRRDIAAVDGLSFWDIQPRLETAEASALDKLHRSLDRDYEVITYLLQHAAGLNAQSIEQRVLVWDYRVMRAWYSISRAAAPEQARKALAEMAQVLRFLALDMGERAAARGRA